MLTIWLDGGPSQLETWDPHPDSPIGGPTRAIDTTLPGVRIAADFPRMAEQLHHLSLVRSLVSKEGDHARALHFVRTGYRPDGTLAHPSLGSIVTRELPAEGLDLPPFVSLGHTELASRGGYLGGRFDAFLIRDPGRVPDAADRGQQDRMQQRLKDLDVVSRTFAQAREPALARTLHRESLDAALRMMTSAQVAAFDVSTEPQPVRDAYGNSQVGRACLIARRLIELGVRAVDVTHLNYDTHEDNFTTTKRLAGELDGALAALVRDLVERDLLESTVVLCLGEFGRTPQINPKEGRDHWPSGFSCLIGGGGLASGVVVGATDPTGARKEPESPVGIPDLGATVLGALGIDPLKSVVTPIGRPMKLSEGTSIERLRPT